MSVQKHEWRKHEIGLYLPKARPEIINIPELKFITISGEGNPNSQPFSECVSALYAMSYAIKMTLKKLEFPPKNYTDYTVYPLEGVYDINDVARKNFTGTINKDDLVYTLMIRQPDFVDKAYVEKMQKITAQKKSELPISDVKFENIKEGQCIQMLHVGSFDDEPASFKIMEDFASAKNVRRLSKMHREIYLNDFRKVATHKLKTVLRFQIHI